MLEKKNNTYVIIGTKAQLVKMAPVMLELEKRKIDYTFISTGQHQETIKDLISTFQIKKPDFYLYNGKDITKIWQMLIWSIGCIKKVLKNKRKIFPKKNGIVLVHGDTYSTILGAVIAKICHQKVGYIEAGLRSFDIFNPFPEEIFRLITSRLTDIHFCPGDFAYQNSQKYKGIKINTKINTLYDSLQLVLKNMNKIKVDIPKEKYCIASIHRFENLFKRKIFQKIIKQIEYISKTKKVLFILHKPTKEKLIEYGFYNHLKSNPNIELRPRYDYFRFIKLLNGADFIVTDGGSNQEECYYLGKPCLLMRKTTERQEGIGSNVVISNFDDKKIKNFSKNYKRNIIKTKNKTFQSSKIIIKNLGILNKK
ncbi:MAG TPA: UDP-N-acetylglucosamine 2-epimerase [Candidatus Woesebacteria bacterium]|nr:UDP-N-acetylglucosamine 2-epimerase [Candidatus Woesebacteria bacterium]